MVFGPLDLLCSESEHLIRAVLFAVISERCAELSFRQGRCQCFRFGIGKIAQVANRCPSLPCKNHQGISDVLAAEIEITCISEPVSKVGDRRLHRGVGHAIPFAARLTEEVRHIGVEPTISLSGSPKTERAAVRLIGQHFAYCFVHARLDTLRFAQSHSRCDIFEVEQWKGARRRLLRTAIRIAVQVS